LTAVSCHPIQRWIVQGDRQGTEFAANIEVHGPRGSSIVGSTTREVTMYRRTMLAVLGAALLVLARPGTRAADKDSDKEHMHHGPYEKCAVACGKCTLACESCSTHCAMMVAKGEKKHMESMRLCRDCADVCTAAAKITARKGLMATLVCEGCAKACDRCGKACDKFEDDKHMMACAKSCKDCAKACRSMIKHLADKEKES
jgi:hypothetical protein